MQEDYPPIKPKVCRSTTLGILYERLPELAKKAVRRKEPDEPVQKTSADMKPKRLAKSAVVLPYYRSNLLDLVAW